MPELADRHCVPILHYRKSAALAAVRSCHLLVRREHAARGADAGRTDSSGPLGCREMSQKVRTSSWLSRQICSRSSPRHFFVTNAHSRSHLLCSTITLYCQRSSASLRRTLATFLVDWFYSSSGDLKRSLFYLLQLYAWYDVKIFFEFLLKFVSLVNLILDSCNYFPFKGAICKRDDCCISFPGRQIPTQSAGIWRPGTTSSTLHL